MSLEKRWNDIINKRERRKELEGMLTSIKEEITFAELNKSSEDDHADSRLDVMLQDLKGIETELNSLDNVEDEYQSVLKERIEFICKNDEKSKQFLNGVDKAIKQLDKELTELNTKSSLLCNLKKQAEAMLKEIKCENINIQSAKDFILECDNILCEAFGKKAKQGEGPRINELYLWELYQNIDELDTSLKEKMQILIPQVIELNMRREEYLEEYAID